MKKLSYTKCVLYKDEQLTGWWTVSYKLDGVRALVRKDGVFSRNGKPLYNLDFLKKRAPMDVEIFCGSWENTITKVRTQKEKHIIIPEEIYSLNPLDERLIIEEVVRPSQKVIHHLLKKSLEEGFEGIVLRQLNKWYKVKPFETFDVPVIKILPGKGKHLGRMGALMTPMGKVGTGFSDEEREATWNIGEVIEVKCGELTREGKFRFPSFCRRRFDKSA